MPSQAFENFSLKMLYRSQELYDSGIKGQKEGNTDVAKEKYMELLDHPLVKEEMDATTKKLKFLALKNLGGIEKACGKKREALEYYAGASGSWMKFEYTSLPTPSYLMSLILSSPFALDMVVMQTSILRTLVCGTTSAASPWIYLCYVLPVMLSKKGSAAIHRTGVVWKSSCMSLKQAAMKRLI